MNENGWVLKIKNGVRGNLIILCVLNLSGGVVSKQGGVDSESQH